MNYHEEVLELIGAHLESNRRIEARPFSDLSKNIPGEHTVHFTPEIPEGSPPREWIQATVAWEDREKGPLGCSFTTGEGPNEYAALKRALAPYTNELQSSPALKQSTDACFNALDTVKNQIRAIQENPQVTARAQKRAEAYFKVYAPGKVTQVCYFWYLKEEIAGVTVETTSSSYLLNFKDFWTWKERWLLKRLGRAQEDLEHAVRLLIPG